MLSSRNPLSVTLSVWKALFLREALGRLFSGRAAAFWLIAEPLAHVVFFVFIFTVIRVSKIGGIDAAMWLIIGLITFFLFRRVREQVASAVRSNQALFAYRQVKPIDSALVRAGLEGFVMALIFVVTLVGMFLMGHQVMPDSPILVMAALFGVWLMGLGLGLVASVAEELVPELGHVNNLLMVPLYFISGVVMPIATIVEPYRNWLLFNPMVHGLELTRAGFSSGYHVVSNISLSYLYQWGLISVFFGLALHRRFATRLVTQ